MYISIFDHHGMKLIFGFHRLLKMLLVCWTQDVFGDIWRENKHKNHHEYPVRPQNETGWFLFLSMDLWQSSSVLWGTDEKPCLCSMCSGPEFYSRVKSGHNSVCTFQTVLHSSNVSKRVCEEGEWALRMRGQKYQMYMKSLCEKLHWVDITLSWKLI